MNPATGAGTTSPGAGASHRQQDPLPSDEEMPEIFDIVPEAESAHSDENAAPAPRLAKRRRIITVDPPDTKQRHASPRPYTNAPFLDDVLELLPGLSYDGEQLPSNGGDIAEMLQEVERLPGLLADLHRQYRAALGYMGSEIDALRQFASDFEERMGGMEARLGELQKRAASERASRNSEGGA